MLRQITVGGASLALILGCVTLAMGDEAKGARKPGQGRPQAGKQGEGRQISPELLKRFDKNNDGKLDESERTEMMLTKFDKNSDGKLDGTEKAEAMLQKFDKNGNGKLDEAEKAEVKQSSGGRPGAGKPGAGKPGAGGPQAGGREAILKKFDKNGDGKLDEAEKEAAKKALGGRPGAKPRVK